MFSLIFSMQILAAQSEGSKERFDAILARFGFSGISAKNENVQETPIIQATERDTFIPKRVIKDIESVRSNLIPDEGRKQVKHGFYTFTVKRKKPKIIKKSRTLEFKGGPFTIDPGTGVKVPNPQLLNERIKNPVFKSRNPRRKNTRE